MTRWCSLPALAPLRFAMPGALARVAPSWAGSEAPRPPLRYRGATPPDGTLAAQLFRSRWEPGGVFLVSAGELLPMPEAVSLRGRLEAGGARLMLRGQGSEG
jgi:hypothetical protein